MSRKPGVQVKRGAQALEVRAQGLPANRQGTLRVLHSPGCPRLRKLTPAAATRLAQHHLGDPAIRELESQRYALRVAQSVGELMRLG